MTDASNKRTVALLTYAAITAMMITAAATAVRRPRTEAPSQDVRYRQGTVIAFNPVTLENTVDVGGTAMVNLQVLGVADAAALRPGAVVGLVAVESSRGITTYAILGRLVTPGSPGATDTITATSQRIYTDTVATNEGTSSGSFTDLATIGPAVTATIGASGRALVILGASMAMPNKAGAMGFEVSGASSLAADLTRSLALGDNDPTHSVAAFMSRVVEVSGLTPGENVFTAKYMQIYGSTDSEFQDRNITVFAL